MSITLAANLTELDAISLGRIRFAADTPVQEAEMAMLTMAIVPALFYGRSHSID